MTNLLQLLGDGLFVFAAVGWALEWRQRRRAEKRAQSAFRFGRQNAINQAIDDVERFGMVFRLAPDGKARWMDSGSQWDREAANGYIGFDAEPSKPELAGHTVYPQLAPEALAAEDVPRPEVGVGTGGERTADPVTPWPGHLDEAGDDTLTRTYIAQGGWERDQQAIAATGQSLWFLAWQQRQAVA